MASFFKGNYIKRVYLIVADVIFANIALFFSLLLSRGVDIINVPLSVLAFIPVSLVVFLLTERCFSEAVKQITVALFSFAFCVVAVCVISGELVFTALEWISAMAFMVLFSLALKQCEKKHNDNVNTVGHSRVATIGCNGSSQALLNVDEVKIAELLGRNPIELDKGQIFNYIENKTVMVTGGGGSIGSELCRQIARHNPKRLIIFDIYENSTYDIQNELKREYKDLDLVCLIGSVRDAKRLENVFDAYRPEIVYHAAAHKHVPLMEDSPNEAVKNNVFGTLNTVRTADKFGASRFVLISTDKAVNPTNIMGATKRICEMIVQTYNKRSKTEYVAVRFGNVLGSNGSVIPLFEKQIENGGPVTVTHPDIIRFFMTISEAVSLVLQAGANAKGGEIFVLDMGEPVKILDLAENMIKLSGFEPYVDIDIKFSGLRPGEKLYEELLMGEEGLDRTENALIYIGKPIEFDEKTFFEDLESLEKIMSDDKADIRGLVHKIVPTFKNPKEVNEKK